MQIKMHNYIFEQNFATHNEQVESPLHTKSALFLKGLLCIDLSDSLQRTSLIDLVGDTPDTSILLGWSGIGTFGCQLYVSTKELHYAMC